MKIKNKEYLLVARALGSVILNRDDIIERQGKNLKIKSSVFDEYVLDKFITAYIVGTKTINQYQPVLCDGESYTLLYIEKINYEYFPWDEEESC